MEVSQEPLALIFCFEWVVLVTDGSEKRKNELFKYRGKYLHQHFPTVVPRSPPPARTHPSTTPLTRPQPLYSSSAAASNLNTGL